MKATICSLAICSIVLILLIVGSVYLCLAESQKPENWKNFGIAATCSFSIVGFVHSAISSILQQWLQNKNSLQLESMKILHFALRKAKVDRSLEACKELSESIEQYYLELKPLENGIINFVAVEESESRIKQTRIRFIRVFCSLDMELPRITDESFDEPQTPVTANVEDVRPARFEPIVGKKASGTPYTLESLLDHTWQKFRKIKEEMDKKNQDDRMTKWRSDYMKDIAAWVGFTRNYINYVEEFIVDKCQSEEDLTAP